MTTKNQPALDVGWFFFDMSVNAETLEEDQLKKVISPIIKFTAERPTAK